MPNTTEMEEIKHLKIVWYGIGVMFLESVLMGIWFYVKKPELDVAMAVFPMVFLLIGINLILGLLSYFLKKPFTALFLGNAIICPLIFYAIWIVWFMFYAQYPS